MREKAEKFTFQAEVNRMMKLIINSLYRNKEIFLRELISNASDALDKIRVLSLTDKNALSATEELSIRIKSDKDNRLLHITDTGIGMTRKELVSNLGTIAKSGTSEFLQKVGDPEKAAELNDMIGQFGVGFYSAFLVADRVVVTSKNNDDKQHIWESDAASFSLAEDPRGDTLKRGTTVTLHMKEEAQDFLEHDTLKNLIKKYSQFINFNIYLWSSKTETVEEPVEEETKEEEAKPEEDEEIKVEEEEEKKPKTKKVEKTTWDWELITMLNLSGLASEWRLSLPVEIEDSEYNEFYKSITKDQSDPLSKTHFIAEGEVTFKSLLFVPSVQPSESFNKYGSKMDHIKLYVRRVFITDDFQDMMPNYLSFVKGVVDSDDLPLNVSRETLQQHKLLKVIKKKLVRKTLDMIKKIPKEEYHKFWKEYSTNYPEIWLSNCGGVAVSSWVVIEDPSNRTRLAKLLRFESSQGKEGDMVSLAEYVERMKEKQDHIYYMAGLSRAEVERSPFVERLLKKGYEVLYLTEPVDEYAISSIPEFEGKKFQNVAKDGLKIEEGAKAKEKMDALSKQYEVLTKWMEEDALKDKRLASSPCALVASQFGWTGNMERLARSNAHSKAHDTAREYYMSQKKTLEVNPYHPVIKELLRRVENVEQHMCGQSDKNDEVALNMANLMYETATLRSGYMLGDTSAFADRVDQLLRKSMNIPESAQVEEEEIEEEEEEAVEAEDSKADVSIRIAAFYISCLDTCSLDRNGILVF
ncbi:HSP90B1 [Cordylochernes scorpioides]|uniref:Heat shock protein 83 n=1 Tax=Cordylochernes scorpioides TaxID=51811 RepID=A0ABY6KFX2_9ARAC|nr:HSP90B1 [Cordylochernes scorpioides]